MSRAEVRRLLAVKFPEQAAKYEELIFESIRKCLEKCFAKTHHDAISGIESAIVKHSTDAEREKVYKEYAFQFVGLFLTVCNVDALIKSITSQTVEWWDTSAFDAFKQAAMADIKMHTEGVKVEKSDLICKNSLCRSDKCVFYLEQTRSADEGMTAFVVCTVCSKRYRLG